MRLRHLKNAVLGCCLALLILSACPAAQARDDGDYAADRQKAVDLYAQGEYMEALPLLEDLANRNPQDDAVLVRLAACVVNRAATLDDQAAAAKELIRARELLLKAKELGNNSALLQNLLQLIPVDGVIQYANDPASQAIRAGEAAFAKRDFDEAIKDYSKALELDPKNYSAALFVGDSYFAMKDFPKAAEWYEDAVRINPDKETAYRYYADMLTKNGEMAKARAEAIEAVVAEPYNPITWRGLQAWASANHVELTRVHIQIPTDVSQKDGKATISMDPSRPADVSAVWLAYGMVRAKWPTEEFAGKFPQEKKYRHTLAEESEALTTAAKVMADLNKKKKSAALRGDEDLATLLKLFRAGMIEPYILLDGNDEEISQDYAAYRKNNREKLEEYLGQFVVPPAPAKP